MLYAFYSFFFCRTYGLTAEVDIRQFKNECCLSLVHPRLEAAFVERSSERIGTAGAAVSAEGYQTSTTLHGSQMLVEDSKTGTPPSFRALQVGRLTRNAAVAMPMPRAIVEAIRGEGQGAA